MGWHRDPDSGYRAMGDGWPINPTASGIKKWLREKAFSNRRRRPTENSFVRSADGENHKHKPGQTSHKLGAIKVYQIREWTWCAASFISILSRTSSHSGRRVSLNAIDSQRVTIDSGLITHSEIFYSLFMGNYACLLAAFTIRTREIAMAIVPAWLVGTNIERKQNPQAVYYFNGFSSSLLWKFWVSILKLQLTYFNLGILYTIRQLMMIGYSI